MMELECYYLDDLDDEVFWPSEQPVPMVQSSFVPYTEPNFWFSFIENEYPIKRPNAHKRMLNFLRTIPTNKSNNTTSDEGGREFDRDRNYNHKISERLRREKQKNTFTALHSLLPPGTKNEKNCILKTAALHLQELKKLRETLHKRNHELENNVYPTIEDDTKETDTFRLRRQTPPSGIDSMIGVLTTMKSMGLKARSIQSEFSNTDFFAVLEIEQKIDAVHVENAVENALKEVERKFICNTTPTAAEWYSWLGYTPPAFDD